MSFKIFSRIKSDAHVVYFVKCFPHLASAINTVPDSLYSPCFLQCPFLLDVFKMGCLPQDFIHGAIVLLLCTLHHVNIFRYIKSFFFPQVSTAISKYLLMDSPRLDCMLHINEGKIVLFLIFFLKAYHCIWHIVASKYTAYDD